MQIELIKSEELKPPEISGLQYISGFITADEEQKLLRIIDAKNWQNDLQRRVQHYGFRYDYKARTTAENLRIGALPDWLLELAEELKHENLFKQAPDQVIINEYQPGQGIAAHIDCIPCFGETIASLSLGGACVMNFEHQRTNEKSEIILEPRSLLILSDEARYEWKHGIKQKKSDFINGQKTLRQRRISLTFRNVINSITVHNPLCEFYS